MNQRARCIGMELNEMTNERALDNLSVDATTDVLSLSMYSITATATSVFY